MIRRDEQSLRRQYPCTGDGHPRPHPEWSRLIGGREYHATLPTTNDDRFTGEHRFARHLNGREEGIHVNVHDVRI
jgi:hypothetical protein